MAEGGAESGTTAAAAALDAASLERLRPSLVRFFERRSRNPADVEDLVQEVFFHLARQVDLAAIQQPERYVFRIATNVLRDRLRRGAVRRTGDHVPLEEVELGGEAPSAERVYHSEKMLEQVLAVLDELTPKCRTTFLLQRFEGLSYSQIARRLGVSRSAVEKQMMHVIQVLSDHFPE
ncbi:RNA polymerase sigma factor [Steroidobacter sp.]|uniref:RNA polymerase sigma factor n=1 Tax=Steroidobacter sp. TaxID=1978227 RepID=UPI001A4C27FE|nr:RNA polymerase sigma factor [Steroidobacter sp.]MBL8271063.1 RNA polymerase sigma factor [Steroidobacter sp.]